MGERLISQNSTYEAADRAETRRTAVGVAAALVLSTAVAVVMLATCAARGQEPAGYTLEFFSGPRGTQPGQMHRIGVTAYTMARPTCYAIAALSLDELNRRNPTKDFAARCETGPLLTLPDAKARALQLINAEGGKEER